MLTAKVIPVYKNGDDVYTNNYRPISLLPVISKIFERIVYNRLYKHLNDNKLLFYNQFGFQANNSTEHAITELVGKITTAFDDNKYVLGVFIDLSKAFDTVDHQILLNKLQHYGIKGSIFQWIKSYLTNRNQFVLMKTTTLLDVLCGVPQGSILGPLLFFNLY